MQVRFWGVRGSVPCATPQHVRYGGNTSCVSVEVNGHFIVFDAGSGIRDAGNYAVGAGIMQTHLFLSHVHIDHILGFPFYRPLWDPAHQNTIYAAHLEAHGGLKKVMHQAFADPIFPVPLAKLASNPSYVDFQIGQDICLDAHVKLTTTILNHPNAATGYRLCFGERAICYVTDTEHNVGEIDANIKELIRDADLVIYDSSYTDDEYSTRVSWGHSTWQEGIRLCREAGAKSLCIYHHDPDHDDDMMDGIAREAKSAWDRAIVARQGLSLTLA